VCSSDLFNIENKEIEERRKRKKEKKEKKEKKKEYFFIERLLTRKLHTL